ncbi:MAG: TetR/AcrR family transcriptional regulator [bacterium]|nr:TetR/AcrR family transcriptional regulator [bacterium]
MAEKTLDRRVRKTRALYRSCLAKLLKEKKIQEISVREISELADLNRGTFYLHYRDVFDLLDQIETELLDDLNETLLKYSPEELKEKPSLVFQEVYTLVLENQDILEILMGDNGDLKFITRLKEIVKKKCLDDWMTLFSCKSAQYSEAYYYYMISGCIGLAEYWMQTGMKESPAELAELSEKILLDGIKILGE